MATRRYDDMMELSAGSIDALGDDNLTDILVRLDALFVLRCRAVCKRWRRIATDRSFLAAHAAARPREMIVETVYSFVRSTVPLSPTDMTTIAGGGGDDGHHRYLFEPRPLAADGNGMCADFELYASLDGLLVLKQWWFNPAPMLKQWRYVICNPVRRQWANLPVPAPRRGATDVVVVACGFYFHASSGKYRLLLHCVVRARHGHWGSYCCVVSVGSALPRRLPHAPPSEKLIPYYENPVCYRGTLHWLSRHPQSRSTGKMLAFDTFSETFRLMPRPPEGPEPMTEIEAAMSILLELDGELNVATIYGTTLDIWALQDYEAEEWALRHRLKVQPPPPTPRWLGKWKRHPIIMGNASRGSSAILVGFPPTQAVMAYSLKDNNKVDRKIDFGGLVSFKVFSESLVPHAFLDSPDTVCVIIVYCIFS